MTIQRMDNVLIVVDDLETECRQVLRDDCAEWLRVEGRRAARPSACRGFESLLRHLRKPR